MDKSTDRQRMSITKPSPDRDAEAKPLGDLVFEAIISRETAVKELSVHKLRNESDYLRRAQNFLELRNKLGITYDDRSNEFLNQAFFRRHERKDETPRSNSTPPDLYSDKALEKLENLPLDKRQDIGAAEQSLGHPTDMLINEIEGLVKKYMSTTGKDTVAPMIELELQFRKNDLKEQGKAEVPGASLHYAKQKVFKDLARRLLSQVESKPLKEKAEEYKAQFIKKYLEKYPDISKIPNDDGKISVIEIIMSHHDPIPWALSEFKISTGELFSGQYLESMARDIPKGIIYNLVPQPEPQTIINIEEKDRIRREKRDEYLQRNPVIGAFLRIDEMLPDALTNALAKAGDPNYRPTSPEGYDGFKTAGLSKTTAKETSNPFSKRGQSNSMT